MQFAHAADLIRGLLLCGWACAALAQAPTAPPADASTPLPAAAPVARPALTLAEPTSGRPPGRLIALPVLPEGQLRELAVDVATHLEITGGYKRLSAAQQSLLGSFPAAVTPAAVVVREEGDARHIVRLGYVVPPRRLPQLWVQSFTLRGTAVSGNPDGEASALDPVLKMILAERSRIFARLRLSDLATRTIPLSYVDTEAALFALRAMGYAVITDSEGLARDDWYKGEDVDSFELARGPAPAPVDPAIAAAAAQTAQAAQAVISAMPAEEQRRFLPRFPAIRNLPTTISLDRLPLIVKMPSTEARNMGLVGGELTPAQRDQTGLTIIPSAASPLSETVAGGASELLIVYHPAYPEQLSKLTKLVHETIDRPARQVFVEGLVLEISDEGLKELGVQWDLKKGTQSFSLGSMTPTPLGGSAFSFLRDGALAVSPSQMVARINALVQSNKAEILSRPSVMTLDNRQATIRVGTDIPVATSQDASGSGSGSNRVAFSFQYIPTGILLNIRPRVSDDLTEISMLIDATVSSTVPGQDLQVLDPTTRIPLASAPTIATRRVQTYARILDNQPLIIGGLLSRNQIKTTSRVPLLGNLPIVGALFGHTSVTDDRREVIIVLTPSIVTENIRETKAQYPKDDERFDVFGTTLFKEHHRIRAEDLIDSSDLRFNARFRTYKGIAQRVIEQRPELAARSPFSLFTGAKIPGEFFFVTGMMYRMLDRLNAGDPIRLENLKFFERSEGVQQRPVSITQLLARHGDGSDPQSFFARNPGKALALTFPLARASLAAEAMYTETTPEVRLIDCPDRAAWSRLLWDMSQPDARGLPRYTILIHEPSDLRRLQLAYATQNTVLNNGGVAGQVFDKWLVGRMLHLQEVTPTWERILNAQIAQYFFIGQHYYMYFVQENSRALKSLEAALRTEEMKPLLEGVSLP
jgi:general secretion pathway protein D